MVESTTALRNRIKAVLSAQGYGVECFNVSSEALEALEASKPSPYTVIISSYMMPKMKGDEILKTAREVSPHTQRILIADVSELETLVNAVNLAGINACLTLPFNDQDLLHQTELCCRQYDMIRKQNHFKRLTQHQNRQLFQMAGNYKKKDLLYLSQLEQKKKEIRILESRIRSAGGSLDADKPVLLQDILAKRNIAFSPEALGSQFVLMKKEIKQILETSTPAAYITLAPVPYKARPAPPAPEAGDTVQQAMQLFFALFLKHKPSETHPLERIKEIIPEDMFEVRLSKNNTQAFLTLKTGDTHLLEPSHVRRFLEKKRIINGVKEDHVIQAWLFKAMPGDPPFVVAAAGSRNIRKTQRSGIISPPVSSMPER
nr:response regulator [Desulfobacula sp.]